MLENFNKSAETKNTEVNNSNKRFDVHENNELTGIDKYNPVKRIEMNKDIIEDKISFTPAEGIYGHWSGERGDSKFVPTDSNMKSVCEKYGLDGVSYKKGEINLKSFADTTVKIDMTEKRTSNFNKAYTEIAKKWNKENRDGRSDWSAREAKNWRIENNYTIHECGDKRTCQLVPSDIHSAFSHSGGVHACKIENSLSGGNANV